jgi:hypothetical protein
MPQQNTYDVSAVNGGGGPVRLTTESANVTAGAWSTLLVLQKPGRRGRVGIRGAVAGQALAHLRLIRAQRVGGCEQFIANEGGEADANTATVVAEDGDFATLAGTVEIQNVMPANPHETAAGGGFDLILAGDGVAEYALQAKSATGTAQVTVDINMD